MEPGTEDELQFFLYASLSFFTVVLYIPLLYRMVYRVVQEKQSRVREAMQLMGMNNLSYWLSWYTDYTIKNVLIVTLCWAILKLYILKFSGDRGECGWVEIRSCEYTKLATKFKRK